MKCNGDIIFFVFDYAMQRDAMCVYDCMILYVCSVLYICSLSVQYLYILEGVSIHFLLSEHKQKCAAAHLQSARGRVSSAS